MGISIKRKNKGAIQKVYNDMSGASGTKCAVGFPAEKQNAYPDGKSVASVAARNNYGIGVPQRDFMGLALPEIQRHTKEIMSSLKGRGVLTVKQYEAVMNAAGTKAEADIKKAIVDLTDPPNAPATIAKKGSSNPLIDTGHMVQSVTHVIRKK
jgi:hypothetical protein